MTIYSIRLMRENMGANKQTAILMDGHHERYLLSIIVGVNSITSHLFRTIDSIRYQDSPGYSVQVIIKLAYTDSVEINALKNECPNWLSIEIAVQPDSSLAQAWNQSLMLAKGRWILFWGAGETFPEKNTLSSLSSPLLNSQGQLVSGGAIITDTDGRVMTTVRAKPSDAARRIYRTLPYHHNALFHSASIFQDFSFDCSYKYSADYDLLLRSSAYKDCLIIQQDVVVFQNDGMSSDLSNSLSVGLEFFKAQMHNVPLRYSYLPFFELALNAIKYVFYLALGNRAASALAAIGRPFGFNTYHR